MDKFNLWKKASEAYYDIDSEAIMSDIEFDNLTEELKNELDSNSEEYKIVTKSITRITGQEIVTENNEMVSLFKIQFVGMTSYMEIRKFFNRIEPEWIAPKFDGHAIRIIGKQIQTRGGQDITKYLINHPTIIKLMSLNIPVINCEMVLKKKVFLEKWDKEVIGEKDGYANARNAVGGVLKKNALDLTIIPLTDGVNPIFIDGFGIWSKYNGDVHDFHAKLKTENYPILVDGVVLATHTDKREIKDNYPLNMVSVKFESPTAKTKVIGITWSQKKTGVLTPVYDLEPVQLDGSIIKAANAYNIETIKDIKCGIGSEVLVTKSNEIMPIIKKVITKSNNIQYPDVDYVLQGKNLVAVDMQISYEYRFILGMKVLQIQGIGDTIADNIGKIVNYDIIEIFNPDNKPKLLNEFGMGSNFEKICQVYTIKTIPIDMLIEMLQFPGCGKVLSRKFGELITGKKIDTSGIDYTVLTNVCKGEGFKKIQSSMSRLKELGIKVIKPVEINDETITFEMTNNPPGMTKKEFTDKVKIKYPNSAHTTLTKNTTYLFTDSYSSDSSKMNKARKYGTKIITYDDFIKSLTN